MTDRSVAPAEAPDAPTWPVALLCAVPAWLLALALLAPFLHKAFTIDDTVFLREAEHVLTDPLHPTAFSLTWTDVPQRLSSVMASGPVIAYLLAPAALLGREWPAHVVMLALLALAAVATAALALRLGHSRRAATVAALVLVATPAVLGMAGTAMPDVPAMAFGVLGIEQLVAWRDRRRTWHAALAAVFLALAMLCRTQTIMLLPIGALFLWPGHGRPRLADAWRAPRMLWAPLLVAPVLVVLALRVTQDPSPDSGGVARAVRWWATLSGETGRHAVAFLSYWATALPLTLPWLLRHRRRLPWWLAFAVLALLHLPVAQADPLRRTWLVYPLAVLGLLVLADVVRDGWRRGDRLQLALGAWLLAALPVVFYVHMAPKYLLVSAPAVALLLTRGLDAAPGRDRLVLAAALAVGAALGVLILRADAEFADLGRRAAAELIAPEVRAGRRVWFAGHWGFQWYAERAGARPITRTPPRPAPGDVAVSSMRADGNWLINGVPGKRIVRSLAAADRVQLADPRNPPRGGRLMSGGAGFFSDGWGYLPWMWSRTELDRYDLWEIADDGELHLPGLD